MRFKLLFLFFVLVLLVGSVYAFGDEDNIINNLVNSLGLNKPFLKDKERIIVREEYEGKSKGLITARAVTGEEGACTALNGVCVDIGEECPDGYWLDVSLNNACPESQKCCTENVLLDNMESVGRVYVYSGISLVARIDPE